MEEKKKSSKLDNFFVFILTHKYLVLISFFVVVVGGGLVAGGGVHAESIIASFAGGALKGVGNAFFTGGLTLLTGLLAVFVWVLGGLVGLSVDLLQIVASYGVDNQFASNLQVIVGWKIVRDVANSFFIVVLIIIAISTIIGFQQYHFKKSLPKFILAAILVNFSRTLCLLAINFSTAIMSTFISAIGGGWSAFTVGLRAPATTAMSSSSLGNLFSGADLSNVKNLPTEGLDLLTGAAAQVVGVVMLIIVFAAIMYAVIILVVRIVMLWLLMIISPLAFFLFGMPGKGGEYWKQWLKEFTSHVIVGPLLAFFLYLDIMFFIQNTKSNYSFDIATSVLSKPTATITQISRVDIFLGYIVGLAILLMGLEITQKLGVRGGKFAEKVARGIPRYAAKGGVLLNNLAYINGAPTIKPIKAFKQLKEDMAYRMDKSINDRQSARRRIRGEKEKHGQSVGGFISGVLDSDSTYVREHGFFGLGRNSLRGRMARAMGFGVQEKGSLNQVKKAKKTIEAQNDFSSFQASNSEMVGDYAGVSRDKLRTAIDQTKKFNEFNDLDSRVGDGDLKAGDSDWENYQNLKDEFNDGDFSDLLADEGIDDSDIRGDLRELEEMQQLIDDGSADGSLGKGFTEKSTVGDFESKIGKTERIAANKTRLKDLKTELRERQNSYELALSGSRAKKRQTVAEEKRNLFVSGRRYGAGELTEKAMSYMNPRDKDKFSAVMQKAAESGKWGAVNQKLNSSYALGEADGLENFHKDLQEKLGMTETESMDLIDDLSSFSKSAGRLAETSKTKRDGAEIRFTTIDEQEKDFDEDYSGNVTAAEIGGTSKTYNKDASGKYQTIPHVVRTRKRNALAMYDTWSSKRNRNQIESDKAKLMMDSMVDDGKGGKIKEYLLYAQEIEKRGGSNGKEKATRFKKWVEDRAAAKLSK